jgi:hypothetical protein
LSPATQTETVTGTVARIVHLARKFWAFDLKRERISFAVTSASRMVQVESGEMVSVKQKLEAEEILRKGKTQLPG